MRYTANWNVEEERDGGGGREEEKGKAATENAITP